MVRKLHDRHPYATDLRVYQFVCHLHVRHSTDLRLSQSVFASGVDLDTRMDLFGFSWSSSTYLVVSN